MSVKKDNISRVEQVELIKPDPAFLKLANDELERLHTLLASESGWGGSREWIVEAIRDIHSSVFSLRAQIIPSGGLLELR